jgi:hypothetical protein
MTVSAGGYRVLRGESGPRDDQVGGSSRCFDLITNGYIGIRYLLQILNRIPMESISLKLPQALLETSDKCARALGIPRAEYIRRAIERMNFAAEADARAKRMMAASRKVREESMRVNTEFAKIEHDPDA